MLLLLHHHVYELRYTPSGSNIQEREYLMDKSNLIFRLSRVNKLEMYTFSWNANKN